jgi:nicotinamide phosphoribosyltransferase
VSLPTYLPPLPYNSLLDADSYKVPHWQFYRPGIKRIYSFIESRGGEHDEIMLAGLQPVLYKLGQPVQDWEIEEAQAFFAAHFGFPSYFNKKMWDVIVNKHDRKLPLEIRGVPEGLMLPKKTPLVTVENTDDEAWALTSYKETMLLRAVWPASSIATRVFRMKRKIKPYFDETSDNGISPFAILDFCSRGVFGYDHSAIAGAAFAFMFQGSDNMPGIRYANYFYDHPMAAFSVAATEHSIASGFGSATMTTISTVRSMSRCRARSCRWLAILGTSTSSQRSSAAKTASRRSSTRS